MQQKLRHERHLAKPFFARFLTGQQRAGTQVGRTQSQTLKFLSDGDESFIGNLANLTVKFPSDHDAGTQGC